MLGRLRQLLRDWWNSRSGKMRSDRLVYAWNGDILILMLTDDGRMIISVKPAVTPIRGNNREVVVPQDFVPVLKHWIEGVSGNVSWISADTVPVNSPAFPISRSTSRPAGTPPKN